MTKMDKILGVIQGYEGKIDTTMELMLDIHKRFEEKLEALREENGAKHDRIARRMKWRKREVLGNLDERRAFRKVQRIKTEALEELINEPNR